MASYTFYADASDISVRNSNANFATARNAASGTTSGSGSSTTYASCGLESGTTYNFYIVFYPFDTSSIPSSETVTAATFSFSLVGDNSGTAANQWAVTQSTQATWNGVAGGDFDQRGTLELATRQNRKVSAETGYQDMTFTSTGRGQIARSGETKPASASATGKTQLVMAWAKDLDNSAPAGNDYNQVYLSEQTGTTNDPKLAVTTADPITFSVSDTVTPVETVTALRTRLFSLSDTATISETITSALGKIFSAIDTATITETVTSARTRIFTALDTLAVTEPYIVVKKLWETVARAASSFSKPSRTSDTWSKPDNPYT